MLPFRQALGLVVGFCGAWLLILALMGLSTFDLWNLFVSLAVGIVFVMALAALLRRNAEQTRHAQELAAELRETNAELLAARQRERELAVAEERVRLAREIHDGLGHHLTVLSVQLQVARKLVESDPARAAEVIETCRTEARSALEEARRSVAMMRRTPLDGRSLEQALTELTGEFDAHSDLGVRLTVEGEERALDPARAMTLFRAAQEGLTNAQKHAHGAEHVTVALQFGREAIFLRIRDDGRAVGAAGTGGGFGLLGLRERVEQLGGRLTAGSGEGGGFELVLEVPREGSR
jgi:signal transduction histidine kinase